ncbi:MAG TPA: Holliday junction branch migration protein RuvA [Bacteroidetes bacterium]|nr:Holliday junction branch migration protein RuvA [Bacteroidota bacterium]
MIAFLNGKLAHKDPAFVIIECHGVGYRVRISLNTYAKLGKNENVKLHTHLMIKDDSHELFGFFEPQEKVLFQQLIGISGVGGVTALTILSSISPKELYETIESEDVAMLKKVKGIGAKTAGRIILELKGKLVTEDAANAAGRPVNKLRNEAIAGLVGLGLPKAMIEKRVDAILKKAEGELTVSDIIRDALRQG